MAAAGKYAHPIAFFYDRDSPNYHRRVRRVSPRWVPTARFPFIGHSPFKLIGRVMGFRFAETGYPASAIGVVPSLQPLVLFTLL